MDRIEIFIARINQHNPDKLHIVNMDRTEIFIARINTVHWKVIFGPHTSSKRLSMRLDQFVSLVGREP